MELLVGIGTVVLIVGLVGVASVVGNYIGSRKNRSTDPLETPYKPSFSKSAKERYPDKLNSSDSGYSSDKTAGLTEEPKQDIEAGSDVVSSSSTMLSNDTDIPVFWRNATVHAAVVSSIHGPLPPAMDVREQNRLFGIPTDQALTLGMISELSFLDLGNGPGLGNSGYRDFSPIGNLGGLEIAENLIGFSASGYGITDLSSLVSLVNLQQLVLQHNQIEDLSPLLELPNLNYLDLKGNPLSEVTKSSQLPILQSRVAHIEI